ncbi:MAG: ferredoxin [Betaproteobacteria bacterium]|nr:ferredoxin [Betaproteobacteria bacterium]
MYVILTSKPGQFRTEAGEGLKPVEAYDYLFCGRRRAHFVIAELEREVKVRIVEESGAPAVNLVPSKFLPRFATLEHARAELAQLAGNGAVDATLVAV